MKKLLALTAMILSLCVLLCGCLPMVTFIPDAGSVGESAVFEKDGIKLTLTDRFIETESEMGFYAYYTSNFCGVVVQKEEYSSDESLDGMSLEEYVGNVIENNGLAGVEPQNRDGLWFYSRDKDATRSYSFFYEGTDAFWSVQFICMTSDAPSLEEMFFLWADSVEVE